MTGTYHGSTLGALSVTGVERIRRHYHTALPTTPRLRLPFCAHCPPERPFGESCAAGHLGDLDALLAGPAGDSVAAVVVEPVVAHASGCVTLPRPYVDRLLELRARHGFLIIADEITTALGRTGELFVSPGAGLRPDLTCVGKGLGVGYAAISAVLLDELVVRGLPADRNLLGHNYNGHPPAVAVARQVLARLGHPALAVRLQELGRTLSGQLGQLAQGSPYVRQVRTAGLLAAVDLVPGRHAEDRWDPSLQVAEQVARAAFAAGLLVLPGSGNVDGVRGDHVTLAPPFVTSDDELAEMVHRLAGAIERVSVSLEGARSCTTL
jgi:adenosylmethionine-8-amino-7-oxononanoate aminotransferase